MAKFQSPLLGYNNNVRHRGRIFHIQTEDSGVNHPHIITHLFMDGGRILKSVKKSYAEHVGSDNMSETVRVLMKEQHKAMFIALRDGQFDALVDGAKPASAPTKPEPKPAATAGPPPEERSVVVLPESTSDDTLPAVSPPAKDAASNAKTVAAPAPDAATKAADAKATDTKDAKAADAKAAEAHTKDAKAADAKAATPTEEEAPATLHEPPRAEAEAEAASEDSPSQEPVVSIGSEESIDDLSDSEASLAAAEPEPDSAPSAEPVPAPPSPEPRRPSAAELTLDFDALERDTSVGMNAIYRNSDLPPPPAALFAKHEAGTYRATEKETRTDSVPTRRSEVPARPPRRSAPPPPPSGRPRLPSRPSESRYAPARPAAIFGASTKPAPSIFSDELLTDKSLDEVILSYLAEDLDPPRRK